MTLNQNTMISHYQQLQPYERGLIMARKSEGWSCRQIARELHRSPSTISRELKHGTIRQIGPNHKPFEAYFAETAQKLFMQIIKLILMPLAGWSRHLCSSNNWSLNFVANLESTVLIALCIGSN